MLTRRDLLWAAGGAGIAGLATYLALRKPATPRETLPLPAVKPEDLGIDPHRLDSACNQLETWTAAGDGPIPAATLCVGRHGRMLPPQFFGRQRPAVNAPPIRPDAVFLLASITKPITYLCGLMLVERGLLQLREPVVTYIPEFAKNSKEGVLVSHLFTHTSGLPDMLENNEELRREHAPLERFTQGAIEDTSLAFEPGTKVQYQSMGTLIVAELVRRLSNKPLAQFMADEIFRPLGLRSTSLGIGTIDPARVVDAQTPPYQSSGDFGWNSAYWRGFGAPWGGLFSTPADFAVLCQLFLNGGAVGGVRLLSPEMTRRMTTNRLGDYANMPETIRRTNPWGLGWKLNHPAHTAWGDTLNGDVFGHTGATGTLVWMDPRTGVYCMIWTNAIAPGSGARRAAISNMVAASIVA